MDNERSGERMKLGAFFHPTGNHVAGRLHPDAQIDAGTKFRHYAEITQTAERGKFDLMFVADAVATREKGLGAAGRKTYGDVWPPDGGLRLHRSATARRTNFAGVARSRRRLRQHAAGKVAEIEVAAGQGRSSLTRRSDVSSAVPAAPTSAQSGRASPPQIRTNSMLEGDGFEPSVPGTKEAGFCCGGRIAGTERGSQKGCFLCGTDGSNPSPSSGGFERSVPLCTAIAFRPRSFSTRSGVECPRIPDGVIAQPSVKQSDLIPGLAAVPLAFPQIGSATVVRQRFFWIVGFGHWTISDRLRIVNETHMWCRRNRRSAAAKSGHASSWCQR